MKALIIVTDSSKLYQLARFCESRRGVIKSIFLSGKARGYLFFTTETNLRRAWQAYEKELKRKGLQGKMEKLKEIFLSELELLIDKVVPKEFYEKEMPTAEDILNDNDPEKEDSQALALAIALKKAGFRVLLWTNDNDFLKRTEEIEVQTGVKVVKAL